MSINPGISLKLSDTTLSCEIPIIGIDSSINANNILLMLKHFSNGTKIRILFFSFKKKFIMSGNFAVRR